MSKDKWILTSRSTKTTRTGGPSSTFTSIELRCIHRSMPCCTDRFLTVMRSAKSAIIAVPSARNVPTTALSIYARTAQGGTTVEKVPAPPSRSPCSPAGSRQNGKWATTGTNKRMTSVVGDREKALWLELAEEMESYAAMMISQVNRIRAYCSGIEWSSEYPSDDQYEQVHSAD